MSSYLTAYGELKTMTILDTYSDNKIKDCIINERIELHTPLGILTPQYEHAEMRRKHTCSISFFPNGKISRIALNEQKSVETSMGRLPAELITFYENGSIKRLFPLNGQISGYWDEDNEYNLAEELCFDFSFGSFKTKIIAIAFYENGAVRSLTLWPKERIKINTPMGEQQVRIGFSLYSNGSIKSFEPAKPINVITQIGLINAFDINAIGISGDQNSLSFHEDGSIKSLTTSSTKVIVSGHNISRVYSPIHMNGPVDNELFFRPLKIDFEREKICFNGQNEYILGDNHFKVEPYSKPLKNKCSDCSSCSQCSSGSL